MRKSLLLLAVLALFLSPCAANQESRIKNVVIWNQEQSAQGSGVLTEYGVLTAAHVVQDSVFVFVQHYGEENKEIELVRKVNKEKDLALVTCSRENYQYSEFANTEPEIDSPVHTISSGWNHFWSVKRGYISNIEGNHYIVDLAIYPGDSGAPLYNEDDEIIGVVQAVDVVFEGPGQGYACRLSEIKDFLNE